LTVSAVGFGGYRTGRSDPTHREALRAALQAGVNLIDTSSNYMLGDSERLVGEVLAEGLVPRAAVGVDTKMG
jgi:aryl-alcohol dehydrogenase-like predicted oxidoreductase